MTLNNIKVLTFKVIANFSLFIYPLRVQSFCESVFNHIYSYRIGTIFKHFGKNNYIIRKIIVIGGNHISIGDNCTINKDVHLASHSGENNACISIGNYCNIGESSHITCFNKISIGDNLLTGKRVLISDNSHGNTTFEGLEIPPMKRPIVSKGPISIGNNVWLGDNVIILAGVTIGDGVVVGANSVVNKDIPSYSIAAGIPASIIKNVAK